MPVWETTLSQVSISVASLCGRVSDARVRTKLLILSPTTTKENPLHLARWPVGCLRRQTSLLSGYLQMLVFGRKG